MATPSFARGTITRLRPGTRSERGSDVPDWANPSRLDIPRCSVQPAATALDQDGRVLAISDGLTVYAPPDADVLAGDRIEYAGQIYEVNGVPRVWHSPSGRLRHVQLILTRWAG